MKILFKNRTKYTKEVYQVFLQFHNKKYSSSYYFYTAFITLLIFFCFGMNLQYHNFSLAVVFFFAMCTFLYWRFFHPIEEIKKELKTDKIEQEKEFQFRFFENSFEVLDKILVCKVKYFNIKHIFETEQYFYLYIDRNHAFLLDKSNFVIGNVSNFRKFIKRKCPLRFQFYKLEELN